MTIFDFVYFDAGGGHRSAATALKQVMDEQSRPWEVRMVNLQEVLDSLDIFRKVTGIRLENIYNQLLANGWTLGSEQGLRLLQAVLHLYYHPTTDLLERHWAETRPDVVVSLVPNFNRPMRAALLRTLPDAAFVTILTDLADFPPHFWIERRDQNHDQYLICGTARAVEQAQAMGYAPGRIRRTSGMILRPNFYIPVTVDRDAERRRLGLDPGRPVGLVLFGGQGSKVMLQIAGRLPDTQLILICGRNEKLVGRLRAMRHPSPRFVEGFTSEVPYYMSLADFFIGKPGPGSISEAVQMGLPVIVERNMWTLPQERYNTEWVEEHEVGVVVPNFRHIGRAVRELLADLPRFRRAAGRIENRAVFEIPEILAGIAAGEH